MHNPIQHRPVLPALLIIAKNTASEGGAVEWTAGLVGEQQVRRGGGEVADDGCVAGRAGLDDLAGEEVGVDDGEGVGGLGEEGGDG